MTDKEATASEAGLKHEKCTVCGFEKAAVEIPATGEDASPQTGDSSNIILWLVTLLAAGVTLAALTGVSIFRRTLWRN